MKLTSSVFEDNQNLPSKYTCDGEGVNPPLQWNNVPGGAKSLALIVDDPDAPNGLWSHWLIWNIDPTEKEINENAVPKKAVVGMNSSGLQNYDSPCPPSGIHRYRFKLYALKKMLSLAEGSNQLALERAITGNVLERTQITALYQKV